MSQSAPCDAVVIGAGFYGCAIAAYLARRRGLRQIVVVEREAAVLQRASYNNQARIHNGYHYPRSFTTAYRSRVNLPRFVRDWPLAVRSDFTKLYAIARSSKVTARQFARFCAGIGAALEPADPRHQALFEPRLVEAVYQVQEHAFDTTVLARWAAQELAELGVPLRLGQQVRAVRAEAGALALEMADAASGQPLPALRARHVFNCTYSGLDQAPGAAAAAPRLKHEITEMGLVRLPPALEGLGITVMDGPYFSAMPFPARGLHTLSHVRYTPHLHWLDEPGLDPYERLARYPRHSRVDRMLRDAARYLPAMAGAQHLDSLWEVKTVLLKNESDDGRPILFERSARLPGLVSVLGGKIDNIYDVLERLDAEPLLA